MAIPARRLPNWLLAYRDYTTGTESPEIYHLWSGISTICAAAQRKIYWDFDYFITHSNMYIVLVGPSGVRKSSALKLSKNIAKGVQNYGHKINFSTNAGSAAGIVQQFGKLSNQDHQSLTVISSEFGTLVRASDTDMVLFLTDIYDCDPGWDKQTVGRGLELIESPWFNLLGATTPDWMMENLGKLSIEGGFVRRVLFIYAEDYDLVAYPKMTDVQKKLKQDLTHDLAVITQLKGTFDFLDDEAREFFKVWYEDKSRLKIASDSRLRGYMEVKAEHVKKVAMALSLSEGNSLRVSTTHLKMALGMLGEIEQGMTKALGAVGKNPFNSDMERITTQVTTARSIPYKKLFALNVFALEKEQFDKCLITLQDLGRVFIVNGNVVSPDTKKALDSAKGP